MLTRAISIRPDGELIRESVCACAKLLVDEEKVHMAQIESWKNKNIDGFYTKTTQKGGFSKLCVKIKKRCYTDLLHFSTRTHNLVFFSAESYFDSKISSQFFIYSFFQEKTLGDISFKLCLPPLWWGDILCLSYPSVRPSVYPSHSLSAKLL